MPPRASNFFNSKFKEEDIMECEDIEKLREMEAYFKKWEAFVAQRYKVWPEERILVQKESLSHLKDLVQRKRAIRAFHLKDGTTDEKKLSKAMANGRKVITARLTDDATWLRTQELKQQKLKAEKEKSAPGDLDG